MIPMNDSHRSPVRPNKMTFRPYFRGGLLKELPWVFTILLLLAMPERMHSTQLSPSEPAFTFGHGAFFDLDIGDEVVFQGRRVKLTGGNRQFCELTVDSHPIRLKVSKLTLPIEIEGIRVFVADNRYTKDLTDDTEMRGLLTREVLLCLSDASKPLLDATRFSFPISLRDGFQWRMGEESHMFAYLGPSWNNPNRFRSHEGIDFDLHDARGMERHPILALEESVVVGVWRDLGGDGNEGCIILGSATNPKIYYVYKHLWSSSMSASVGDSVRTGEALGYTWGDGIWGHLHFSIVHRETVPGYRDRYQHCVNSFPALHALWTETNGQPDIVRAEGDFDFGRLKGGSGNIRYNLAYTPVLGYGWLIEDWCGAEVLPAIPFGSDRGFILLQEVVHSRTRAEAKNPLDHYVFAIDVLPGEYQVKVLVGDYYNDSWQKVVVQDQDFGTYKLEAGAVAWTPEQRVSVSTGQLLVRIHYPQDGRAGIARLVFKRSSPNT